METIRFEDLELDAKIMRAITDMGFEAASPIQGQAIPLELQGLDIIGQAQTGTGKTAAFGIPLLQKIDPKNKKPQAIILCPTRELAIQVSEEIRRLAKYMHGVKVLPIYGGQEIGRQIRSLKDGVQVIIGTPGRVMDHMRRKTVKMDPSRDQHRDQRHSHRKKQWFTMQPMKKCIPCRKFCSSDHHSHNREKTHRISHIFFIPLCLWHGNF